MLLITRARSSANVQFWELVIPPLAIKIKWLLGNWELASLKLLQTNPWTFLNRPRQGGRISFGGQVQNYQAAVQQVVNILGDEDSASNYLSKCIFTVGMGSNDYLNNYFMPAFYSTGRQYTPEQYADDLINRYSQHLTVYKLLLDVRFGATYIQRPSYSQVKFYCY